MSDCTLWSLLDAGARSFPDRVLVSDAYGRTLTLSGLKRAAERAAVGLDLSPSSVVAWQLPNCLEAVVVMLAAARVGARQIPLIPILRRSEVVLITEQVPPDLIIVPEVWRGFSHGEMAREIADPEDTTVRSLDLERPPDTEMRLPSGEPALLPSPPEDPDACHWVYYSSGTTGKPKGAKHTDATLIASSHSMTERLGISEGDVYPIAWPITHIGGATMLSAVLRSGGHLVLFDTFDPQSFGERVASTSPTILGTGVPFFRAYLDAQHRHVDRALYPSLRVFTAGGAPTPAEIIAELIDTFGVPGVVNSWGLTEFPIASCPPHTASPERLSATVGPPSPGVRVRIVEGELRLKGPQCFLGYVIPGLDEEAFDEDGWFRTGDLGTVDHDGYVRITGRRKDIIIRNGENLFPAEIEEVLLRHPAVADAAVVGVPDRRTGERVAAVVVPDTDRSVSLEEVRRHFAREGVARQKTPEVLKVVNRIPRSPMGKALKEELKAAIDWGQFPADA